MLLDTIFDFDVIKVLGYGLAGFSFLLMFFAFLLLRQVISTNNNNPRVFKSIYLYMGLSFAMSILIGVFTFFTQDYKKTELQTSQNAVQQQAQNVQLLIDSKKSDSIVRTIVENNVPTNSVAFKNASTQQAVLLDSIQKKIDNPLVDSSVKVDFSNYKKEITATAQQLSTPNISKEIRDSLALKYVNLNHKITNLPTQAIKQINFKQLQLKNLKN